MTTLPADLSDDDLLERARQLRRSALRGQRLARGPAHEHEREVRRRFPPSASPSQDSAARPRSWQFWKA